MKRIVGLCVGLLWACGGDESEPAASVAGAAGAAGAAGGAAGVAGQSAAGQGGAAGVAGAGAGAAGQPGGGQAGAAGATEAVPCEQCFPVEALPEELRARAEEVLLAALDTEALFSIVGGLKPMSTGFLSLDFPEAGGETGQVAEARQILAALRCTPMLSADLQVFHAVFDGQKAAEGVFFRRPLFDEVVAGRPVFEAIGVGAWSSPIEVVDIVDKDATTGRFRAYGHLFGYPDHAVDFFVQAEEQEAATGEFVERDFFHIPTFSKQTGSFTYAVPKGYKAAEADLALRTQAADVLASYQKRRAQFIGEGKGGPVALLRSWFDDGAGQCSPAQALIDEGAGSYQLAKSCWAGLKSCNPISNEGCDSEGGSVCVVSSDGPRCVQATGSKKIGQGCSSASACEAGARCQQGTCAAPCCGDVDCGEGEECAPLNAGNGTLGVCREVPDCKPAGGSCSKAADCCSGDCHVGHCH